MKDNRFIELLNLYIDRQITEAETTELEAEIQSNPKCQAVYRQYCQIHAATKLVYDSFRVNATEQPVLPTERAVSEVMIQAAASSSMTWPRFRTRLALHSCRNCR